MKILIEGYNKSIHKHDNQILIKEKDDELEKINIKIIDDIMIIGRGSVTFDALRLISDNNIPLMSIDYFGKINYILEYPKYENIFLRKKQYEFSENHQGLSISREIIRSKLLNQRFTIRTLNKSKNIDDVKFHENKINESVKTLDKLRFGPMSMYPMQKIRLWVLKEMPQHIIGWQSVKSCLMMLNSIKGSIDFQMILPMQC